MRASSRPRRTVYSVLSGIVAGVVVATVVLATAPRPTVYQWPPTSQVENLSTPIPPGVATSDTTGNLAPDCTTMLVDVDSTVPARVWVIPYLSGIPSNFTVRGNGTYYWSGSAPVSHVSAVVTVAPPGGIILLVSNASGNESGLFHYGFVFSASDCPHSGVPSPA